MNDEKYRKNVNPRATEIEKKRQKLRENRENGKEWPKIDYANDKNEQRNDEKSSKKILNNWRRRNCEIGTWQKKMKKTMAKIEKKDENCLNEKPTEE